MLKLKRSIGAFICTALLFSAFAPARAEGGEPHPSEAQTTVTVRFVGDIMVSKPMMQYAQTADGGYDFHPIWNAILPELHGADLLIGNLETPIAGYENGRYTGFPRFNAPDEFLLAVRDAGFDVLTNTNNHLLDRGVEGALTTTEKIRALGMLQTGVYLSPQENRILMTQVRGVKLAILAYSYRQADKERPEDADTMRWLQNFNDPVQMQADIRTARTLGADAVLVFTHMGQEGTYEPSRLVREMAQHLADSGADAAIFCHSHAVQPFDRIETADGRSVFVAYALGNFLSDGLYTMSRSGMILELPITLDRKSGVVTVDGVRYVPTYSEARAHADGMKSFGLYAAGLAMDDETLPQFTRKLARESWDQVRRIVGETFAAPVRSFSES